MGENDRHAIIEKEKYTKDEVIRLMNVGDFKKKPIVIQACQIPEEFEVETLEGTMKGKAGDWLIIGVKGEMYPCDDEIFKETYEEQGY